MRQAIDRFNAGRGAGDKIKIHDCIADPLSDGHSLHHLRSSKPIVIAGKSFDIKSWSDADEAFTACFSGTVALAGEGVPSVAAAKGSHKTTTMSAQYIPYSRAQKAIVAQVMASMNWTKRATATECLYVHFMVSRAKARELADEA